MKYNTRRFASPCGKGKLWRETLALKTATYSFVHARFLATNLNQGKTKTKCLSLYRYLFFRNFQEHTPASNKSASSIITVCKTWASHLRVSNNTNVSSLNIRNNGYIAIHCNMYFISKNIRVSRGKIRAPFQHSGCFDAGNRLIIRTINKSCPCFTASCLPSCH